MTMLTQENASNSIMIQDETMSGNVSDVMRMIFDTKLVTLKEVISRRVMDEVAIYNKKCNGVFNGLIKPTDAQAVLNGYTLKPNKAIDAQQQISIALTAFTKNDFFVLVDNQQLEHLDDEIMVASTTNISFVKLTPLVGG